MRDMETWIGQRVDDLQATVRYELVAYDSDGEVIAKVSDQDIDEVVGRAHQVEQKVNDKVFTEATEDFYDVEPAEY